MIFKVAATLAILLGLTATAMAAPAPGPDPGIKKRLVTIDKFPQFGSDKIACVSQEQTPSDCTSLTRQAKKCSRNILSLKAMRLASFPRSMLSLTLLIPRLVLTGDLRRRLV